MTSNFAVLDRSEDEFLLEADTITRRARLNAKGLSRTEQSRVNVCLARSAALRNHASGTQKLSDIVKRSTELRAYAERLIFGRAVTPETRDMGESVSPANALVPFEMYSFLIDAISQVDPLFDEDSVRLISKPADPPLQTRPTQIAGWDASADAAELVSENSQEAMVQPLVGGATLAGYMFRKEIEVSFEFEQDVLWAVLDLMSDFFAHSLRRGVGIYLATGSGSSQPQGIVTGAADSGVTTSSSTVLTADDFEDVYFSLNAAYRDSPKCAWVMNDVTYKKARKAIDGAQRPLINVEHDRKLLMDRPVLISPSMPSTAGSKAIAFGDLSHFVVRLSGMQVVRTTQTAGAGSVTYGGASFKARMRADSVVLDPSAGSAPPIVYATLHS